MAGSYGWKVSTTGEFIEHETQEGQSESEPQYFNGHFWYPSTGDIPPGAVKAGVDKDGGAVFVGRAFHNGEIVPAKVVANQSAAFIPWGGEEHAKGEFEVLCKGASTVIWQESSGGAIPAGAVTVGVAADGERLHVGRVFHDGTLTPGKIQPSHGVCYIPYGGLEISFPTYEVLVLQ